MYRHGPDWRNGGRKYEAMMNELWWLIGKCGGARGASPAVWSWLRKAWNDGVEIDLQASGCF